MQEVCNRQAKKPETDRSLITKLTNAGETLDETVSASIINCGQEIIPALIAILKDEKLGRANAPGRGFVPIHAVELIQQLKAIEAYECMIQLYLSSDPMEIIYSKLIFALESFGPAILEPTLTAYDKAKCANERRKLAIVLAGLGVQDARIFPILLRLLDENTELAAGLLAKYGDPSALPHLSKKMNECRLDSGSGIFSNHDIVELAAAIEELGGELSEQQENLRQAKYHSADSFLAPLLILHAAQQQIDAQKNALLSRWNRNESPIQLAISLTLN